jgi:hypothetical protein
VAKAENKPISAVKAGATPLYSGPEMVWRDQRMAGMWRGQRITALRESMYGALYFTVFEQLKKTLAYDAHAPTGTSYGLSLMTLAFCGGMQFLDFCSSNFFFFLRNDWSCGVDVYVSHRCGEE